MNELELCRSKIDRIDTEMRRLFIERMKVAEDIAKIKKREGLPIFQPEREAAILAKRSECLSDDYKELYLKFLRNMLDLSKEHQKNNEK